jgi:hypothetical protein
MQISKVTEIELALLIHGLRAVYVADLERERRKLAIQLENELETRFGKTLGSAGEQERAMPDLK